MYVCIWFICFKLTPIIYIALNKINDLIIGFVNKEDC